MKNYIIFIITFIILFITFIIYKNNKNIKTNINSNNLININYPSIKYQNINKEIDSYIKNKIYEFDTNKPYLNNIEYYIYGKYNQTSYKNINSYIIFTETYTGGAHPNHEIWTISHIENKIITIDTLIKDNPNILNILSYETYNQLANNKLFKQNTILDMLKDGTKPNKNNFKNFLFSKKGLIIYFERYQIAPYYYGEYYVIIPYNKLNLKITN